MTMPGKSSSPRLRRKGATGGALPPGIRGRAILDGRRAAWARQYDEWSFVPEARILYLERIRSERDQAFHQDRCRSWAGLRATLSDWRSSRIYARVDREVTGAELETARRWRDIAREREDISLEGLDILAGINFPRPSFPWGDEDEPDADPETVEPEILTDQSSALPRPRYPGPAGGGFAMLVPPWLRLGILLLLTAVEVPIYLKIFAYFNSANPLLTWTFTLPVAVVMVLAPHLAGKLYRNRQALPREPFIPYLVAIVLAFWFGAGCILGWLRQKVLLVPHRDPLTGVPIGLSDQLHVSPWTMTCVLAIVLLLSGLIAFTLGIAEAHPTVAAYRAAVRVREQAEESFHTAVRAHAEAAE